MLIFIFCTGSALLSYKTTLQKSQPCLSWRQRRWRLLRVQRVPQMNASGRRRAINRSVSKTLSRRRNWTVRSVNLLSRLDWQTSVSWRCMKAFLSSKYKASLQSSRSKYWITFNSCLTNTCKRMAPPLALSWLTWRCAMTLRFVPKIKLCFQSCSICSPVPREIEHT